MAGILTQLQVISSPAQEPVGLADMKTYLHATDFEDGLIETLVTAARQEVEEKTSRAFFTQTLLATFFFALQENSLDITDYTDQMLLELPRSPVQVVTSVSVENTQNVFTVIDSTSYGLLYQIPTQIYMYAAAFGGITYPWWINTNLRPRIQVLYTAGYTDINLIPATQKMMIYKTCADLYLERETEIPAKSTVNSIGSHKIWTL